MKYLKLGKLEVFYGRDLCRLMDRCLALVWGARPYATEPGIMPPADWRLEASWNWLPSFSFQGSLHARRYGMRGHFEWALFRFYRG